MNQNIIRVFYIHMSLGHVTIEILTENTTIKIYESTGPQFRPDNGKGVFMVM